MPKEKVYLIVDEYDSFANRLLLEIDTTTSDLVLGQYLSAVADKEALLRSFVGDVLKTGTMTVLRRMFFTGVTPMAFSDGLSSLNMVEDISYSPHFEMLFGFTEDEIKVGLEHISLGIWKSCETTSMATGSIASRCRASSIRRCACIT
jgi:hypothetical protein